MADYLEEDDVQLPLTRPNLFLLIPYELAVGFGIGFFLLDNTFHSWKAGFAILPLWGGAAMLVKRDFNGIRVMLTRLRVIATMLEAYRWSGQSLTPFPMKRDAAVFRGIRDRAP